MQIFNRPQSYASTTRCSAIVALMLCCTLAACAPLDGNKDDLAPPPAARAVVPPAPVMTFARTPPRPTLKTPVLAPEDEQPADDTTTATPPEEAVPDIPPPPEGRAVWEEGPSAELPSPGASFDFPMVMNRQVEYYVDYFRNNLHRRFTTWLGRANRYLPMIQEKLRNAGLPEDLAYLPLIESGFNLNAYSSASAVGPWQFMRGTAKRYGLTINDYVDERRDPIKSTQAAVAYLRDLYEEFGSWHLAVAAYNAGEGRIRRATQQSETDDFWEIAQTRHLSSETQQYVPKLIAAIMIAKEPEKYGFDGIHCNDKFCYESVYVPRRTALAAVALASNIDLEVLEDLNSELRLGMTPPHPAVYAIKVPPGTKEAVIKNLSRVRAVSVTKYKDHVVRRGETLPRLCRQFGIKKNTLLKANHLRKAKIRVGQRLRIPYTTTTYTMVARAEAAPAVVARAESAPASVEVVRAHTEAAPNHVAKGKKKAGKERKKHEGHRIVHRIRAGETLATLARRYKVSVEQIIAWNRFKNPRQLRIGQQVVLYLETATTSYSLIAPAAASAEGGKVSHG